MIGTASHTPVAVLYSGGLDSSIVLGQLLAAGHFVRPLYVDCGWHWQGAELATAKRFLAALDEPRLEELIVLQMPLADLYDDHWSITGQAVPRADEPDQNVYLPGHNPLLLVKAQVWCRLHGVGQLALGALGSNPFADATEDFFRLFEAAMDRAISGHVELIRPLSHLSKLQVMQLGKRLPLEWTLSCLSPLEIRRGEWRHCGACNKCAERQQAFRAAAMSDPTLYGDATSAAIPTATTS